MRCRRRQAGREYATKATIAKINNIIMQQHESYMTRRVNIPTPVGMSVAQTAAWNGTNPLVAALRRLDAIRDTMRMEMPDHYSDITQSPLSFTYTYLIPGPPPQATVSIASSVSEPALHQLFSQRYASKSPAPGGVNETAKCLFLAVSVGKPEVMEQFNQNEIGVDPDGWQYFVDGWGKPICFLRWAPGFSSRYDLMNPRYTGLGFSGPSQIQIGDPVNDHDPLDYRNVQNDISTPPKPIDFRLIPLVYSSYGMTDASCVFIGGTSYQYAGNPYQTFPDSVSGLNLLMGTPTSGAIAGSITNHLIEQR